MVLKLVWEFNSKVNVGTQLLCGLSDAYKSICKA